jgi:hypothetical protein
MSSITGEASAISGMAQRNSAKWKIG